MDLAVAVLIPDYLNIQLSDKFADGILTLSGAAVFSTLKEFQSGKSSSVDFSKNLTGSVHAHIMGLVEDTVANDCIHFKNLCTILQNVVRANCSPVP